MSDIFEFGSDQITDEIDLIIIENQKPIRIDHQVSFLLRSISSINPNEFSIYFPQDSIKIDDDNNNNNKKNTEMNQMTGIYLKTELFKQEPIQIQELNYDLNSVGSNNSRTDEISDLEYLNKIDYSPRSDESSGYSGSLTKFDSFSSSSSSPMFDSDFSYSTPDVIKEVNMQQQEMATSDLEDFSDLELEDFEDNDYENNNEAIDAANHGSESQMDQKKITSKKHSNLKRLRKETCEKRNINMKDCFHVWEFLRDLLKNEETSNKLVKWLDVKQGLFKLIEPNIVSSLWGMKKNNRPMKYSNMARGIRYSREEGGYFDLVSSSDGKKYGKKLVFKFSRKTMTFCPWLNKVMS